MNDTDDGGFIVLYFCQVTTKEFSKWKRLADILELRLTEEDIRDNWDIIYGTDPRMWDNYKEEGGKDMRVRALGTFVSNAKNQFRLDTSCDFKSEARTLQNFIPIAKHFFRRDRVYLTLDSGGFKKWWQFWK